MREYLRVIHTSAQLNPGVISIALDSLPKLSTNDSPSLGARLIPIRQEQPVTFEFVAISEGTDEPVEFCYWAGDRLGALEQRLRSIYPPTCELERVDIDLVKRLVRPVGFTREEFAGRLEDGQLYHDMEPSAAEQATVSDGGEAAVASDSTDSEAELPEPAEPQQDHDAVLDDFDLAAPRRVDDDEPLTALDGPAETTDGNILARPPVSEVDPYGVEWWGAAARRQDWMTTLTASPTLVVGEPGCLETG